MNQVYFGWRKVDSIKNLGGELIELTYADDGETPKMEVIGAEEWDAGKSESPVKLTEIAQWVKNKNLPLRESLGSEIEKKNLRMAEIGDLLDDVFKIFKKSQEDILNKKLNVKDYKFDLTFPLVLKMLQEQGKDSGEIMDGRVFYDDRFVSKFRLSQDGRSVEFSFQDTEESRTVTLSDWNAKKRVKADAFSQDILEVLRKHNVNFFAFIEGNMLNNLKQQFQKLGEAALQCCLTGEARYRRIKDLKNMMERLSKEPYDKSQDDGKHEEKGTS